MHLYDSFDRLTMWSAIV